MEDRDDEGGQGEEKEAMNKVSVYPLTLSQHSVRNQGCLICFPHSKRNLSTMHRRSSVVLSIHLPPRVPSVVSSENFIHPNKVYPLCLSPFVFQVAEITPTHAFSVACCLHVVITTTASTLSAFQYPCKLSVAQELHKEFLLNAKSSRALSFILAGGC